MFIGVLWPHRTYVREEDIKVEEKIGPDPDKMDEVEVDMRLKNNDVAHCSFLLKQYKAKYWYFEAIECTRKVAITGVCSLLLQGKTTQLCLSLAILAAYQTFYSYIQPFRTPDDNFNM
jgi:hypothetical protein